jgi:hypothetical protein
MVLSGNSLGEYLEIGACCNTDSGIPSTVAYYCHLLLHVLVFTFEHTQRQKFKRLNFIDRPNDHRFVRKKTPPHCFTNICFCVYLYNGYLTKVRMSSGE